MTDRPNISPEDLARMGGAAPALGLKCRVCGCADFRVLETTRAADRIRRRRQCRHCGFRLTTAEVVREAPPKAPLPGTRKRGRPRKVATPPPPPRDGAPF